MFFTGASLTVMTKLLHPCKHLCSRDVSFLGWGELKSPTPPIHVTNKYCWTLNSSHWLILLRAWTWMLRQLNYHGKIWCCIKTLCWCGWSLVWLNYSVIVMPEILLYPSPPDDIISEIIHVCISMGNLSLTRERIASQMMYCNQKRRGEWFIMTIKGHTLQ